MNLLALIGIAVILKYVSKYSRETVDMLARFALVLIVLSMAGIIDITPINGCLSNIQIGDLIAKFE